MTKRRLVWAATYLALAGLVLALWLHLAFERPPEINPETGLAVINISKPEPGLLDRLCARLGW